MPWVTNGSNNQLSRIHRKSYLFARVSGIQCVYVFCFFVFLNFFSFFYGDVLFLFQVWVDTKILGSNPGIMRETERTNYSQDQERAGQERGSHFTSFHFTSRHELKSSALVSH